MVDAEGNRSLDGRPPAISASSTRGRARCARSGATTSASSRPFATYPGKYFTGDGCRRDADGYYWITGRVDDVINVSGHRIGTAEVESRAGRASEGRRGRRRRLSARHQGPGHLAYVTAEDGAGADEALRELVGCGAQGDRPDRHARRHPVGPGLPKTRSGKIMRRILRKIAENDFSNLGDTSTLAGIPGLHQNLQRRRRDHARRLEGARRCAATRDAPVVARLRAAGAVIVGSTNMSEFAFSGVGYNPHYGTPGSQPTARVPGGSSSGAAVSVGDRMAVAASAPIRAAPVRIPAAVCGIVSNRRRAACRSTAWCRSTSLDSIGPLAKFGPNAAPSSTPCSRPSRSPCPSRCRSPACGSPCRHFVMDELDAVVARAFERCARAAARGVRIEPIDLPQLDGCRRSTPKGGFAAAEAYAWHRELIARRGNVYDPLVAPRIRRGMEMSAADPYRAAGQTRRPAAPRLGDHRQLRCRGDADLRHRRADPRRGRDSGWLHQRRTCCCCATPRSATSSTAAASALPCHASGELPVGFMLMGEPMADKRVLAMAERRAGRR